MFPIPGAFTLKHKLAELGLGLKITEDCCTTGAGLQFKLLVPLEFASQPASVFFYVTRARGMVPAVGSVRMASTHDLPPIPNRIAPDAVSGRAYGRARLTGAVRHG